MDIFGKEGKQKRSDESLHYVQKELSHLNEKHNEKIMFLVLKIGTYNKTETLSIYKNKNPLL